MMRWFLPRTTVLAIVVSSCALDRGPEAPAIQLESIQPIRTDPIENRREHPPLEPELVAIQGGMFFMGSEQGQPGEKPVHAVVVSDFEIGKYEVTNGEFAEFVRATGYVTTGEQIGTGRILRDGGFGYYVGYTWRHWNGPDSNLRDRDRQPVIQVSWDDAVAYCKWLSESTGQTYRLPSEAEWEYACRGGSSSQYWWGEEFDQARVNSKGTWLESETSRWASDDQPHTLTTEVGAYPPNPYGLYDTLGNVWEWVRDYASEGYYLQQVRRPESPVVNPKGPEEGENRVLKGGGWNATSDRTTCSYRYLRDPASYRSDHVGFRVVREPG